MSEAPPPDSPLAPPPGEWVTHVVDGGGQQQTDAGDVEHKNGSE